MKESPTEISARQFPISGSGRNTGIIRGDPGICRNRLESERAKRKECHKLQSEAVEKEYLYQFQHDGNQRRPSGLYEHFIFGLANENLKYVHGGR